MPYYDFFYKKDAYIKFIGQSTIKCITIYIFIYIQYRIALELHYNEQLV